MRREMTSGFLYIRKPDAGLQLNETDDNFKPEFRDWIDERYGKGYTAKEILGCIYATLHSPNYRRRYAEFLRIDFPRVPFPAERAEFERLASLGSELIDAHLRPEKVRGYVDIGGEGAREVTKIELKKEINRLHINPGVYFENVTERMYNFQIGGFKPLDLYLKKRGKRKLTTAEINAVIHAANSIAFTIKQMARIDAH